MQESEKAVQLLEMGTNQTSAKVGEEGAKLVKQLEIENDFQSQLIKKLTEQIRLLKEEHPLLVSGEG